MTNEEQASFHILVVDDEPDLEPLIKQRMRPHIRSGKYSFHFAGNGAEALDVLSGDGRIGLAVADVSDKGIPAALFMMSSRTLLKGAAIGQGEPDKVLTEVNDTLHDHA